MILKAAIFSLALFSFANSASALEVETCELSSLSLEEDLTVLCSGTLNVQADSAIETNGFELKLVAEAANFNGLTVFDQSNGLVKVFLTYTADGTLNIVNTEPEVGSDVEFQVGSTAPTFQANFEVGLAGYCLAEASGQALQACASETTVALH